MAKATEKTKPGEAGKLTWQEVREWVGDAIHDDEWGNAKDWQPQYVNLAELARLAEVSYTTVKEWAGKPGFPREPDGTVNPLLAGIWKARRDAALSQSKRHRRCPRCGR